jgi:hypothetical protein
MARLQSAALVLPLAAVVMLSGQALQLVLLLSAVE